MGMRLCWTGEPLEYKGSAPKYVMYVSPTFLFDSRTTIFHMDRRALRPLGEPAGISNKAFFYLLLR